MEQTPKPKIDFSTILYNLLGIVFLCYVVYVLRGLHANLRVVAVFAMMMPMFISICRAYKRMEGITNLERWTFALIALVLWVAQSFISGKLHTLLSQ